MNIANTLMIIGIIVSVIGIILYYIKELKKTPDEIEYESIFSIKYLTDGVAQVFADTQKQNLKEQNLTKRELEAEMRKKRELKNNLKTAAYGDSNAKKFVKSFIKEIIQGKKFGINYETIDRVIPFNHPQALDARSKLDIIFFHYFKTYGAAGYKALMQDYQLHVSKSITEQEEENGAIQYEITEEDVNNVFNDLHQKISLSFDDKLEIVAQRIFADYKGFGPVDMLFDFSFDEIDCGVSGVPKGTYELRKEIMTKDFEYSYNSIYVVFSGINYKMSCLSFGSQDELVRVCQNIYKFSAPRALSRRNGYVVGAMKDGSRIAVARPPVSGSWCFFARKFDSTPSVRPEMLITDEDWLVKDLWELLEYFHKDLWEDLNQEKRRY